MGGSASPSHRGAEVSVLQRLPGLQGDVDGLVALTPPAATRPLDPSTSTWTIRNETFHPSPLATATGREAACLRRSKRESSRDSLVMSAGAILRRSKRLPALVYDELRTVAHRLMAGELLQGALEVEEQIGAGFDSCFDARRPGRRRRAPFLGGAGPRMIDQVVAHHLLGYGEEMAPVVEARQPGPEALAVGRVDELDRLEAVPGSLAGPAPR